MAISFRVEHLDLQLAPAAVLARVGGAINQKPKRVLGILKTEPEFIGVVGDEGFEIWERRSRAIHALGRAVAVRGGTKLELRYLLTPRTRVLLVGFFAVYAAAAVGISQLGAPLGGGQALVALGGGVVLGVGFLVNARMQRSALRSFVTRLFVDVLATL